MKGFVGGGSAFIARTVLGEGQERAGSHGPPQPPPTSSIFFFRRSGAARHVSGLSGRGSCTALACGHAGTGRADSADWSSPERRAAGLPPPPHAATTAAATAAPYVLGFSNARNRAGERLQEPPAPPRPNQENHEGRRGCSHDIGGGPRSVRQGLRDVHSGAHHALMDTRRRKQTENVAEERHCGCHYQN